MNRIIATMPFDDCAIAKGPIAILLRDLMGKVQDAPEGMDAYYERQYRAVAGVLAALEAGKCIFD